jgi:hypothetical protein
MKNYILEQLLNDKAIGRIGLNSPKTDFFNRIYQIADIGKIRMIVALGSFLPIAISQNGRF